MKERDIFKNISPLDHRYSISEENVYNALSNYLSEHATIMYCIRAEVALLKAHVFCNKDLKIDDKKFLEYIKHVEQNVSPEMVYAEDEKTKHSIRALVNVIKSQLPDDIASLVHLGATSQDILDTATSMRIRDCYTEVVIPTLNTLQKNLCNIAQRDAKTIQVGRTHGQHAVPITFGFAIAEYVSRLGKSIKKINHLKDNLRGKLAGPVGAYNGTKLLVENPENLEKHYLDFLGLKASEYSSQIIEPEYLLRLLLETNIAFGIIANLADDLRNLQRSEIGEVFESFEAAQVGSSTMPQKRNPWNSEHVKSLWKAFSPRIMTFYMDQISEHQRDLSNSASGRFIADYIAGFVFAVERMTSIVSHLKPDSEAMRINLENAGGKVQGGIFAEAAYILLAKSGISDAHEIIRKLTLEAEHMHISFYDTLKKNTSVYTAINIELQKQGISANDFFTNPNNYTGLAEEKALQLAEKYLPAQKTP